jgi:hypothetical protein
MGQTKHSITVGGHRYEFTAEVVLLDRGAAHDLEIHAPGVVPFRVDTLETARDTLRSLYAKAATGE